MAGKIPTVLVVCCCRPTVLEKTRTNGVYGVFFSEDVSKGGQHKSLCLRSSSAIMCAFSSVRAHRLSLAPRVDTPPLPDGSQLFPEFLVQGNTSLCDFLARFAVKDRHNMLVCSTCFFRTFLDLLLEGLFRRKAPTSKV